MKVLIFDFLNFLKNVLTIFLVLCVVIVTIEFALPIFEAGFNNDSSAPYYNDSANWMGSIDGSLYLNQISIPGTHDSAAIYAWLGFFSNCQSLTIPKQIDAGYRYLDIRLAVSKGRLKFMHGFTNCRKSFLPFSDNLYLEDILPSIYTFLKKHPSETIIFNVKQEHGNESVEEFETILNKYVEANPEYWYLSSSIPTLDEARGKIVLARRYSDEAALGEKSGLPLIWVDQRGSEPAADAAEIFDSEGITLFIQDRFEYSLADKWKAFFGLFTTNPAKNSSSVLINFLSTKGGLTYGHPFYYANFLNKRLLKLISDADSNVGWLILDFGTAKIAREIYTQN